MNETQLKEIERLAAKIRLSVLEMLENLGAGHLGGSFSITELLAVLYGKQLNYRADDPEWDERDQVVLSKGHAGPALYSALAHSGFFPVSELLTLNQGGTQLPSHPDRQKTIGVDATTGSLGQGTSVAAGIATGLRMQKKDNYVYLIVGDGELNEGQCWEAFQYIAHQKLNHCIVIIDENKKQLDGKTIDILNPFDIQRKMQAFGFETVKVKGDDIIAIDSAIEFCKSCQDTAVCIVLDSVKGQGVEFFEQLADNHSVKFNTDEILQETEKAKRMLKTMIEG